jgi:LacI family transcriptional regulator
VARTSKPTIRDVARVAGVSIATVSYVLNPDSGEEISDPVKARVRDAVRQLNYHRAAAAMNLARRRTRNIGVVLYPVDSDITNPFYSIVIQGVVREAMARDYNLLFAYIEPKRGRPPELPKMIRESNVVGVLFVGRIDAAMVPAIRALGIAVVGVDHGVAVDGLSSVQIANRDGGELAAAHLLGLGHREVAFVGLVSRVLSIQDRYLGFRAAIHAAGKTARMEVVRCDALTYQEGYDGARRLFESSPSITGVFAANDELAAGVMRAARELGRRLPEALSVVGFDDIVMAQYTDPPLTTVRVPKETMGQRAAALLVDVVDGNGAPSREETVPVDLVVRQSTSAAPQARNRPV